MNRSGTLILSLIACSIGMTLCQPIQNQHDLTHPKSHVENLKEQDLQPAASERLLDLGNLGNLFNKYPSYSPYNNRPGYGGYGGYGGGYGGYPSYNYNPSTGSYYPISVVGSGGYYPQSPWQSGGVGTNILGNGGYGGFNGNGGLPSYYGYGNRNYNGQRNLGWGYYRGSDPYGFVPSLDNALIRNLDYRGYNYY